MLLQSLKSAQLQGGRNLINFFMGGGGGLRKYLSKIPKRWGGGMASTPLGSGTILLLHTWSFLNACWWGIGGAGPFDWRVGVVVIGAEWWPLWWWEAVKVSWARSEAPVGMSLKSKRVGLGANPETFNQIFSLWIIIKTWQPAPSATFF